MDTQKARVFLMRASSLLKLLRSYCFNSNQGSTILYTLKSYYKKYVYSFRSCGRCPTIRQ